MRERVVRSAKCACVHVRSLLHGTPASDALPWWWACTCLCLPRTAVLCASVTVAAPQALALAPGRLPASVKRMNQHSLGALHRCTTLACQCWMRATLKWGWWCSTMCGRRWRAAGARRRPTCLCSACRCGVARARVLRVCMPACMHVYACVCMCAHFRSCAHGQHNAHNPPAGARCMQPPRLPPAHAVVRHTK